MVLIIYATSRFFGEEPRGKLYMCTSPVWQNRIRLSMVLPHTSDGSVLSLKRRGTEADHLALWVPRTCPPQRWKWYRASRIVLAYLSSRMRYNSKGLRYYEHECEICGISQWFRSPLCPFRSELWSDSGATSIWNLVWSSIRCYIDTKEVIASVICIYSVEFIRVVYIFQMIMLRSDVSKRAHFN